MLVGDLFPRLPAAGDWTESRSHVPLGEHPGAVREYGAREHHRGDLQFADVLSDGHVAFPSRHGCGASKTVVTGKPDTKHISTSYVERQNLTMRMGMRRFTRLTNAFSKKVDRLQAAVALHFMHYNFARPHMSLPKGMTPAMAAGVSKAPWTVEMIAPLLD